MTSESNPPGVTFKVSAVGAGRDGLGRASTLAELFLSAREHGVEGCGVNTTLPLYPAHMNPFVAAVHRAYSDHFPLVMSPDDVWTVIAQGFATHVNENAETLRSRFVGHQGKVDLVVDLPFSKGGANNPWEAALSTFSKRIADHIGPKQRDLVVGNFTTTGLVERASSEIVLMGSTQKFFGYVGCTRCGIPEITLLGTPADWKSVRDRASAMGEYDLAWWTTHLIPVLDQFVAASQGTVEKSFWQDMYKVSNESGGPHISGWINTLFAYHAEGYNGVSYVKTPLRNPYLGDRMGRRHGPTTDAFPMGMNRVPWKWNYLGTMFDMEFLGGFAGISQDPETHAVRPALAWAVRDPSVAAPPKQSPLRGSLPDFEF